MARFVYFADGLVGSLQRTLELARRLSTRGHDVVVASPVDVTLDAARAGVRTMHLGALDALRDELDELPRPGRSNPSPVAIARWLRAGRAARRASLADRSVEHLLDEVRPDLAIVELEYHTAAIACLAHGTPVVLATGFFCTLPTADGPPLDTSLRPGVDPPADILAAWDAGIAENRRTRRRATWSVSGLAAPFRPVRPTTWNPLDLRAFARARDLDLDELMDEEQWLRPFALDGMPIVSFTPSTLEFATPPDRWHAVGSMLPEPSNAVDRTTESDRTALTGLRARRETGERRPLVFVALGTYWGAAAPLLRTILDAVAPRLDLDVVVGLGGRTDRSVLGPVPEHVTLLDWAPQVELLTDADVAVVHGGVTTLTECAAAGVPMVCFSTHTNEQDGNVARAVHAGIAVDLDHRTVDASEVAAAIDRQLTGDATRAATEGVASAVAAERAHEPAVALLEQLAAGD
ncbi:MAG: glycosyltransferase [Actinomycetota bacterium]